MRRSLFAAFAWLVAVTSLNGQEVDRSLVIEEFDIPTDGDALMVPVRIDDQECRFLVDTGAVRTVCDTSLRTHLGWPLPAKPGLQPPSGPETAQRFRFPELYLGQTAVTAQNYVHCRSLDTLKESLEQDVDGVLGTDVLCQYVVRLDFDEGKLSLMKEVGPSHGTPISIGDRRNPTMPVRLPGLPLMRLLVDTGAIGVVTGGVESAIASELEENGSLTTVGEVSAMDSRGLRTSRLGILTKCSIGGFDLSNTVWGDQPHGSRNKICLWSLTQFNVTLDFPKSVAYLTKNKNFGRANLFDLSGLDFRTVDRRVVVESVAEHSPGEACGIRAQDVIRRVGDIDADQVRLFVLHKTLSQAGERVPIVIERGSETFERELFLPSPDAARKAESAGAAR